MPGPMKLFAAMLLAFCANIAAMPGTARAEEKAAPQGSVILTVAGKIGVWNRGPATMDQTGFFKKTDITFERGMAFDLAALMALPQKTLKVETPEAGAGTFTGPLLKDVLAQAEARPGSVRLVALDGYGVDVSAEELASKDWMLALSKDGKPFGIGDFGPVWLMHTPADGTAPSAEENQKWVWSVFYIEVQ